MSKGKINIIWFRDDEPAKRMRMHPAWLKALTYLAVLLVLLAAGGSFAGYEFWRRAQDMRQEKRDVDMRLSETLLKLERLQNIDQLLRSSDPTEISQLLAGLGLEMPSAKGASQPQPSSKNAKEAAKEAAKTALVEREKGSFDLADVIGKVDLGQVSVEGFRAKIDGKTIQFGFDLNNLLPQSSQSGIGQLYAVTREGSLIPLETGKDDLTFQIQRYKQVNGQALVPGLVDRGGVFGFRLVLNTTSGKTIFSETYPLVQTQ